MLFFLRSTEQSSHFNGPTLWFFLYPSINWEEWWAIHFRLDIKLGPFPISIPNIMAFIPGESLLQRFPKETTACVHIEINFLLWHPSVQRLCETQFLHLSTLSSGFLNLFLVGPSTATLNLVFPPKIPFPSNLKLIQLSRPPGLWKARTTCPFNRPPFFWSTLSSHNLSFHPSGSFPLSFAKVWCFSHDIK